MIPREILFVEIKVSDIVIFDLDNTICLHQHRNNLANGFNWEEFSLACDKDSPNKINIKILNHEYKRGNEIYFWSGRCDVAQQKTVDWLSKYTRVDTYQLRLRTPRESHLLNSELKEKWLNELPEEIKKTIKKAYDDDQDNIDMFTKYNIQSILM